MKLSGDEKRAIALVICMLGSILIVALGIVAGCVEPDNNNCPDGRCPYQQEESNPKCSE